MASYRLPFISLGIFTIVQATNAVVSVLSKDEQMERLLAEEWRCELKNSQDPYTLTGLFCNRTWDNIGCWPDTPAGQVARQLCPRYINMFDQAEMVTRYCTEDGTWWVNPQTNLTWSNYSACVKSSKEEVPQLIQEHMPGIKLMYTIGYSLSLAALVLALIIMVYFKRLHCPRNIIHMNMFLAFGVRANVSLMKNILLVNDLGFANDVNQTGPDIKFVDDGPHWECKLFFTLFYYIIFASVMWLFNEGLYLQLILSVAVFADKTKIRWFVLLGWGFPLLFVLPWVVCRIYLDNMLCWNVHVFKAIYWILHGPMVASVAINFAIFVNIVRMLFTKLRAANCPESKMNRYRKLAKSTLILIPLFAVYYMIFIWLPDDISPTADLFKLYVEMLFNSFQGFLVALLFCFLNHEVQYEIRKKWHRRILRKTGSRRTNFTHNSFFHRSSTCKDNRPHDNTGKHDKKNGGDGRKKSHPLNSISEEQNCASHSLRQLPANNHAGAPTIENHTYSNDAWQPLMSKYSPELPSRCLQSVADINVSDSLQDPLVIHNENYNGPQSLRDDAPLKASDFDLNSKATGMDKHICAILPVQNVAQISEAGILQQNKNGVTPAYNTSLNSFETAGKAMISCEGSNKSNTSPDQVNSMFTDITDDVSAS